MNVLLLASMANLTNVREALVITKDTIEKAGHTVNSDVLKSNLQEFIKKAEEDLILLYQNIEKSLKKADIVIAEISKSSSGIGFLVAQALNFRKPVLVLYAKGSSIPAPVPLKGQKSKLLYFKEYEQKELHNIIDNFLRDIKDKLDTKFILIISPEIDRYLEWAADYKRMHKAQIVRNSVEREMENDKEYEKFLEEQQTGQ
jgi:hypothetical protein